MNYLHIIFLFGSLFFAACSNKKADQENTKIQQVVVAKPSLQDSIAKAIYGYEQRLDIKMKRKLYEPRPGSLVTIQKWFEFGDTTRLVKLREEILTAETKMEIAQYHFINGKVAEIHDYTYNKKCDGNSKECMDEAKYFFDQDTLKVAQKRHAEGTSTHPPVIEQHPFVAFQPEKALLGSQKIKLVQVNAKYASLPFPKPRPEQGTPVRPRP